MSRFKSDKAFTDYVHTHIAGSKIYEPMGWKQVNFNDSYGLHIDKSDGIDYVFLKEDQLITVQERFREARYKTYTDFTIRYRRDHHKEETHHQSEFYKLKAQYFVYGIVNGQKNDLSSNSGFLKYAVIDLKQFYEKIDKGDIRITDQNLMHSRIVEDGIIECPVIANRDRSSSFVPIDIVQLLDLFQDEVVISQQGFI
ncbi:hypothetical protein [Winogradskyella aurantiaca]|uniref:hypothetical protein n=1 Tax=Winogradskyella aurantiaca TaxID=2219558 RepID=UPI000E1D1D7A|nr:hypothetical protein [Winogradskyella aurantiaca]